MKIKPINRRNILFNTPVISSNKIPDSLHKLEYIHDYSLETSWHSTEKKVDIQFNLSSDQKFKKIVIMEEADIEDLKDGFSKIRNYRINEYSVDILQNGTWKSIYTGNEIGACKIIHLPKAINTSIIRISIKKASAPAKISHVALYQ